jgi:DNA-binding transcriptional MocR family regulator
LFLACEDPGDDIELLETATRHGISFDPGRIFRPDNASMPLGLRLCFSNASARDLDEGARRLARAWDAYRRERAHVDPALCPSQRRDDA